jgi:hypothetical protein
MIRSIALACTLTAAAVAITTILTSSAPVLPGPGGVIHAHENLFAALDRGDAEAAASLFTRTGTGMSMNREGKWEGSPGSALYLSDTSATGVAQTAPILEGLAERFKGGKTEIVRAWSDCPSENVSFAILEFEHTSHAGETSRYRSTALAQHQKKGFRFYHWHISPAPVGTAKQASSLKPRK